MEQAHALSFLIQECSKEIGVTLNSEQVQMFVTYVKHLQTWNRSFNLTRITSDEEVVIKHFVDSFAALNATQIRSGSRFLDVGTGAGFPGVPLKIVRPDLSITLIEPIQKKLSFLRFLVGALSLGKTEIYDGNFAQFLSTCPVTKSYDYITTRALKPHLVMQIGEPLLRLGGAAIFYSSQSMSGFDFLKPWQLMSDYSFDLPRGMGHRYASVCSPFPHGC